MRQGCLFSDVENDILYPVFVLSPIFVVGPFLNLELPYSSKDYTRWRAKVDLNFLSKQITKNATGFSTSYFALTRTGKWKVQNRWFSRRLTRNCKKPYGSLQFHVRRKNPFCIFMVPGPIPWDTAPLPDQTKPHSVTRLGPVPWLDWAPFRDQTRLRSVTQQCPVPWLDQALFHD